MNLIRLLCVRVQLDPARTDFNLYSAVTQQRPNSRALYKEPGSEMFLNRCVFHFVANSAKEVERSTLQRTLKKNTTKEVQRSINCHEQNNNTLIATYHYTEYNTVELRYKGHGYV